MGHPFHDGPGVQQSWQDDETYFRKAAARFGLTPTVKESDGAKQADTQLRELLDAGPCAVWIDMAMLPHRGIPPHYQGGGYHVVTAYRIDGGDVLFGDLTDEPQRLPMAEFNAARARIKKFKNRLLALTPAKKSPDVKGLVAGGLADCKKELGRSTAKSMKGNFQLDVLKTWAQRLHGRCGRGRLGAALRHAAGEGAGAV